MTLDRSDLEVLSLVKDSCQNANIDWMLVGALARDVHLVHLAGISSGRAKTDVDIAVAVESWSEFERLKSSMIDTGKFRLTNMTQRLLGIGPFIGRQLDIVPFGTGIEETESQIRWPPDAATAMSVAGFNEAFNSSVTCEIDGQEIRLASVPGLAILKLIAWQDRHAETTKTPSTSNDYSAPTNTSSDPTDSTALTSRHSN
jgi:predicted nucleotidyltransferase